MYRCRHEQDEDPYASGTKNRRWNHVRQNRDIESYNFLRQMIRGGPRGTSSGVYGYGSPRPPRFGLESGDPGFLPPLRTTFGRPPRPPWFPGMCGTMPPSHYDDDDDDDNESDSEDDVYPSPWYHPLPPPWFGSSPLCTTSPPSRSPLGGRLSVPPWPRPQGSYGRYYDDYDHGSYGFMPRPFYPRRCPRF